MRKRFGILVAALILVTGTVFAEEIKKEEKKSDSVFSLTKWDFTGSNVEFKAYLHNSEKGIMYAGKDEDFVLNARRQIDEKTFLQFGYNTDDSEEGGANPDYELEILVNRKFNDRVEAQMDVQLLTDDSIRLREDFDSEKVYIKYKATNNLSLKFNPFDIDLTVGDEFKTINEQKTPGIQAEYKFSDDFKVYVGSGFGMYVKDDDKDGVYDKLDNIQNAAGNDETVLGVKAGFTKESEQYRINGQFAMNSQDDEDIKADEASPIKMALSIQGQYKIGNLNLKAEGLYTKLNKAATMIEDLGIGSETGVALLGKAKYTIGNNTPYVQLLYAGKYSYFNDDDYCSLIEDGDGENHGGLMSVIVGNEYKLAGNLKIIPYLEYIDASNKIYKEDGDKNASDSVFYIVTKVKAEF